MKIQLMTTSERQNWERYSRIKMRIESLAGYLFIHTKHQDRWYFRGYRVEEQNFYQAMPKLEESNFDLEDLSDGTL